MECMKSTKLIVVALCASVLSAFTIGLATAHYKIFPFVHIVAMKNIVFPKPTPTPTPTPVTIEIRTSHSTHYYQRKSFFEQHGGHDYDVVFIGDSLTAGADWQALFPSLKIANRGINGDRADGILNRLDSIYSTSESRAFIMIGLNDFYGGWSADQVFENYQTIVDKLAVKKVKVFIQSTLYEGRRLGAKNSIAALNEKLQLLAAKTDSFTYIDLNSGLAPDSSLETTYTNDGVHLNGDGYAVWKDMIMPYIK